METMSAKQLQIHLDGEPVSLTVIPKDKSKLHRVIAALPFIPQTYMTSYWTTIGSTVAVPARRADVDDFGAKSWAVRNILTMRHEARHVRSFRRLTAPVFVTRYLGPSVTLGLPALVVCLILGLCGLGWLPLLVAAVATVVLAPLTGGLAIGRAIEEWDAFEEAVRLNGRSYAERVADMLWRDYFFTVPRSWTMRHFAKKLDQPEWLD